MVINIFLSYIFTTNRSYYFIKYRDIKDYDTKESNLVIKVISEGDKVGDVTFPLANIIENKEAKFDSTPRL